MTNTYKWTTPNGAKVEAVITVEHITSEHRDLDGIGYEAKCNYWRRSVESVTVNGKATKMRELSRYAGKSVIVVDMVNRNKVMVALPEDVDNTIFGEEREANARKLNSEIKVEKEFNRRYAAVRRAVDDDAEPYC